MEEAVMKKAVWILLAVVSLMAWTGVGIARAEGVAGQNGPVFTADGGFGFMSGSLKYRTGAVRFIESGPLNWTRTESSWSSELEFPKDLTLLEVGASARGALAAHWGWAARLNAWTSLADPSDKVEQNDWYDANVSEGFYQVDQWRYVTAQNIGRVYSESSAELDAFGFDAKAQLSRLAESPIGWIAGYRYQDLSYDVYGLQSYSEGTEFAGIPSGTQAGIPDSRKVVTYSFRCRMPYVGLGYTLPAIGRLQASVEGDYSPWVSVKDKDRHLLHGTQYESRTDGRAWMANAAARYDITQRLFAQAKVEYLRLKTEGDTTKTAYVPNEASPAGITFRGPVEIRETETRWVLGIGYTF
jgi:outer membrane protease